MARARTTDGVIRSKGQRPRNGSIPNGRGHKSYMYFEGSNNNEIEKVKHKGKAGFVDDLK